MDGVRELRGVRFEEGDVVGGEKRGGEGSSKGRTRFPRLNSGRQVSGRLKTL